jgi:hypothetical protein
MEECRKDSPIECPLGDDTPQLRYIVLKCRPYDVIVDLVIRMVDDNAYPHDVLPGNLSREIRAECFPELPRCIADATNDRLGGETVDPVGVVAWSPTMYDLGRFVAGLK